MEAIYRKLFNLSYPFYREYIYAQVKDFEIVDEIFQESLIKLYTRYHSITEVDELQRILFRIVKNSTFDYFRKLKVARKIVIIRDIPEIIDLEWDPFQSERQEKFIREMVITLSPKYRLAIELFAIKGWSHAQIAEHLKINKGTSRSNFFKAKRIIKERYQKEYN